MSNESMSDGSIRNIIKILIKISHAFNILIINYADFQINCQYYKKKFIKSRSTMV